MTKETPMRARALGHLPGGIAVTAKPKDEPVDLTPEQRERFAGTSVKRDAKGYYCHTHRARSDSYPSVDAIPDSKIKFIESTGMRKTADDDQCPYCFDDGLPTGGPNHEHRCQGCGRTFPLGGIDATGAVRKIAAADSDGVMVCLIPEQAATRALMDASGSTEDFDEQHITLWYGGSTDDVGGDMGRERLHRAVYDFAIHSGHDVLSGTANGWGVFTNASDDGGTESVLVALWDIPKIAEFRAALIAALGNHGVPMREENHGFTPHQTMAYADHPITALPAPMDSQPHSDFTHVVISWGNEWSSVALESALAATQQQVAARLTRVARDGSSFDESKHPRGGNPTNPGQFSTAPGANGGGGKLQKDVVAPTPPAPRAPQPAPAAPAQPPSGTVVPESKRPDRARGTAPAKPVKRPKGFEKTPDDVFAKMVAKGDVYGMHIPAGEYPKGDPRNEPEYRERAAKVEALAAKYVTTSRAEALRTGKGGTTDAVFDQMRDPTTGRDDLWDPQRAALHDQIIDHFVATATKGVPREGKCLIMAGPSGAGKSTFLKQQGHALGVQLDSKGHPVNYAVINPDDFKEDIPVDMSRYEGLTENETATLKHEESSVLAKRATAALMSQGYNVIMDVTLGSSDSATKKYVDAPYAKGYNDYSVALVDGDMANSRQNAGNRWKQPDPATGERTFAGRFIPMSLVEEQAPTEKGFRSKNAQEFVKFSQNPKVKRAVVYDPYAPEVGLQEAKRAIHEAIRRNPHLAGILRAEGRELQMPSNPEKTEISAKILAFKNHQIDEAAIVHYLTDEVKYAPQEKCPFPKNSPQWFRWHEDGRPYVPGSFDEVSLARDLGALPDEVYRKVVTTLWSRAVPVEAE